MKHFLGLLLVPLLSASVQAESKNTSSHQGQVIKANKELTLPVELVGVIEKQYVEDLKKMDPIRFGPLKDIEILSKMKRKSLNIGISFEGVDRGTLYDDVTFKIPSGGGVIDLNQYVARKVTGKFLVKFNVTFPEAITDAVENPLNRLSVFFISNSKPRTIDHNEVGSGCNKIANLSKYFSKKVFVKGLMVDSFDSMHVSALAGTFYFMYSNDDELMISAISFVDTNKTNLQCREI